jgi:hypothetical protein
LTLTGPHKVLAFADYVNILGAAYILERKKTDALTVVSKETGLKVNADKTKYMVMTRDKNVGRSHNMKIDNSSFERVEQFRYLGTTIRNQNSIQEQIKSRLKSRNACYYSVQNFLSSSLLTKNIKVKIYRPIILRIVCMCVKLGRSH